MLVLIIHFKIFYQGSDLRLGASVLNLTEPSIASSGSNGAKLPMSLAFGFAFISNEYNYMIAADAVQYDGSLKNKSRRRIFGTGRKYLRS
jgi:hypothetical protein